MPSCCAVKDEYEVARLHTDGSFERCWRRSSKACGAVSSTSRRPSSRARRQRATEEAGVRPLGPAAPRRARADAVASRHALRSVRANHGAQGGAGPDRAIRGRLPHAVLPRPARRPRRGGGTPVAAGGIRGYGPVKHEPWARAARRRAELLALVAADLPAQDDPRCARPPSRRLARKLRGGRCPALHASSFRARTGTRDDARTRQRGGMPCRARSGTRGHPPRLSPANRRPQQC